MELSRKVRRAPPESIRHDSRKIHYLSITLLVPFERNGKSLQIQGLFLAVAAISARTGWGNAAGAAEADGEAKNFPPFAQNRIVKGRPSQRFLLDYGCATRPGQIRGTGW